MFQFIGHLFDVRVLPFVVLALFVIVFALLAVVLVFVVVVFVVVVFVLLITVLGPFFVMIPVLRTLITVLSTGRGRLVTHGGAHDARGIVAGDFFGFDELPENWLESLAANLLRCLLAALYLWSFGSFACVLFDLSVFLVGLLASQVTTFHGSFDPLFKIFPVGLFDFGFSVTYWAFCAVNFGGMPEGCEKRS